MITGHLGVPVEHDRRCAAEVVALCTGCGAQMCACVRAIDCPTIAAQTAAQARRPPVIDIHRGPAVKPSAWRGEGQPQRCPTCGVAGCNPTIHGHRLPCACGNTHCVNSDPRHLPPPAPEEFLTAADIAWLAMQGWKP